MNNTEPVRVPAEHDLRERLLWIGPDDRGLDLEVITIVEPDYMLVIHVMPHRFRGRTP